MSGIFEHLAAFDDGARVAARKAVAVASKRVQSRVGQFVANAADSADREARLALVAGDIQQIVADVAAEFGVDADRLREAVTAGWDELERGEDGKWAAPAASETIDEDLEDAPSAVGDKALASTRVADKDTTGLSDEASPKINKEKAGDEKKHKKTKNPAPADETQKVTDGRGDKEKGTSDLKNETPEGLTSNHEDLPSNDGDAGFGKGGEKGDHTDTWTEAEGDPVSSDKGEGVLSSTDPEKNPIADLLWSDTNTVQSAIEAFEGDQS